MMRFLRGGVGNGKDVISSLCPRKVSMTHIRGFEFQTRDMGCGYKLKLNGISFLSLKGKLERKFKSYVIISKCISVPSEYYSPIPIVQITFHGISRGHTVVRVRKFEVCVSEKSHVWWVENDWAFSLNKYIGPRLW